VAQQGEMGGRGVTREIETLREGEGWLSEGDGNDRDSEGETLSSIYI
jgi:hypothetical protein